MIAESMSNGTKSATPVAVISGGSSGIGLACARILATRGYIVVLLARDEARLSLAAASLAGLGTIETKSLDVTDEAASSRSIDDILRCHGRIDWLITSAGIVEPGMFIEMEPDSHRRQMETNYFGTLNLIRPVAQFMSRAGGGRITLISSAAAFIGIAGYSAYAPGKFAVRGLGEVLRVELAPAGITVSVAFPPDTDTPQLAFENHTKPEVTKKITAGGGILAPERVAGSLIRQAEAGRFLLAPSLLMMAFGWCHSLYAPLFRARQAGIMGKDTSRS